MARKIIALFICLKVENYNRLPFAPTPPYNSLIIMSANSPTSPRPRSRRLVTIAALVGICVCGALLLGVFLLPTVGQPASMSPITTATPRVFAIIVPTDTPVPGATSAPEEPATGQLHLDYPLKLRVDQDDIVQVQIIPDRPVAFAAPRGAQVGSARLLVETSPNALEHKTVSYVLPLYPVMAAELVTARSQDLTIAASSEAKQQLMMNDRNFWTWSLVAKRGGEYHITLHIFGYSDLDAPDPLAQVVNDTRIIQVEERALSERLMQGLAENWLVLFGAGGPIALLVAILTLWFTRRASQKPKL